MFMLNELCLPVMCFGEREAWHPTIFSKLQESWSEVGHVAREMVTIFYATFSLVAVVGKMVKMPPPSPTKSISAYPSVYLKTS